MIGSFFFVFALVFVVFFCGIVFLIVFVVRKSTETKTPEFTKNERREMLGRLENRLHDLTPWDGKSFRNIAHGRTFKWLRGISTTVSGTILSTENERIIAFERVERGLYGDGSLLALSTGFRVICAFTSGNTAVQIDSEPLGTIDASGTIFDASGQQIGHARRKTQVTTHVAGVATINTGDNRIPLFLNSRRLGTIWKTPVMNDAPIDVTLGHPEIGYAHPVITLDATPTVQEEKWLLVLSVLEAAHHSIRVF